jgi:hypothetical protein
MINEPVHVAQVHQNRRHEGETSASNLQAADVRRSERKQATSSKQTSKMESLNAMKASRDRQAEAKIQASPARVDTASPRPRPEAQDAQPPTVQEPPSTAAASPDEEPEKVRESAAPRNDRASSDVEERHETATRHSRPDTPISRGDPGYDFDTESFEASAEEVLSMQVCLSLVSVRFLYPELTMCMPMD